MTKLSEFCRQRELRSSAIRLRTLIDITGKVLHPVCNNGLFEVAVSWTGHGAWTFKQALGFGKRVLQRRKGRTRGQEVARSQEKPEVRATLLMGSAELIQRAAQWVVESKYQSD